MSDNLIGKFAVNEQKALGYVVEKQVLGDQVVYSGIAITDSHIWLTIKPIMVFDVKVDPSSLMEIMMQIAPPKPHFPGKGSSENSGVSVTKIQGSDINSFPFVAFDPFHGMNGGDIFKSIYMSLSDPSKWKLNNQKMPESNDFEVDNDDDSDDDSKG